MKNIYKTSILAAIMSFVSGGIAYWLQYESNKNMVGCSYLDPVTIDVLAFGVGGFFLIEAFIDIMGHKNSLPRQQINRCIRLSFGVSIIVIHILQFVHK